MLNLVKFDLWPTHIQRVVSSPQMKRLQWMWYGWKGQRMGFPITSHLIHRIYHISRNKRIKTKQKTFLRSLEVLTLMPNSTILLLIIPIRREICAFYPLESKVISKTKDYKLLLYHDYITTLRPIKTLKYYYQNYISFLKGF